MKQKIIIIVICNWIAVSVCAQVIPYGVSMDSVIVNFDYGESVKYAVFFYKPANYDSINSPILFGVHGQGQNGGSQIGYLQAIADKRKALIVAPTMPYGWDLAYTPISHPDSFIFCANVYWADIFMKRIYTNTLQRENRNNINMYLIGFSAGGQFVTRYMLIRQGHQDSIPIRMAVSTNPYYYTFCTDSFNGVQTAYPCGIFGGNFINFSGNCYPQSDGIADTIWYGFSCNEHIIQYYNENYAVLIGTADTTGASTGIPCIQSQGNNRYDRSQNFYAFSDSDAVVRGTTLKWQYGVVPGVAHNQNLMYNTVLAGDSIPLAERLLFETPYHNVPSIAPVANFTADTTIVTLPSASVQFYNSSINASSYLWDFGDSTTNTAFNILHTYLYADTFTVTLTAISGTGCDNTVIKYSYIIVKNGVSVNEINRNSANLQIYPNPSIGQITIKVENEFIVTIEVFNCIGSKVDEIFVKGNISSYIYNSKNLNGLYFIKVKTKENVYTGKVVFR